jgi:hypothetical protein
MESALNSGLKMAPARHAFDGTDLEVAHDVQGNDLILRVNNGGVLVFRAKLKEAAAPMLQSRLVQFNSIAPDLGFTVGDTEEGLTRMMRAAGLEQVALERRSGLLRRFLGLG